MKIIFVYLIKVDKGKGGQQKWIKSFLNANIIIVSKVDKGGGKTCIPKKLIFARFFFNP